MRFPIIYEYILLEFSRVPHIYIYINYKTMEKLSSSGNEIILLVMTESIVCYNNCRHGHNRKRSGLMHRHHHALVFVMHLYRILLECQNMLLVFHNQSYIQGVGLLSST